MPETPATSPAFPAKVEAAFAALARYERGSPRGDLVPLDEAVKRALEKPEAMASLEERLIRLLQSDAPVPAKEYVCRKLALLGSARCVPALAPLVQATDADLANAARSVLEALPCEEAASALRDSLAKLRGAPLAGAVTSLGARRDQASVPLLTPLLQADAPVVVEATVVALGRIGGPAATKALRTWQPEAPEAMRHLVVDALLECDAASGQDR